MSPRQNWIHYSDMPLIFATNIRSGAVDWTSSKDGYLGSGNGLEKLLTAGRHTITAKAKNGSKILNIVIWERDITDYAYRSYLVTEKTRTIPFPAGTYTSACYSLNGSAQNVEFSAQSLESTQTLSTKITAMSSTANYATINNIPTSTEIPLRDFRVNLPDHLTQSENPAWFKNAIPVVPKKLLSRNAPKSYTAGQTKQFFVVNTANQFENPHNIDASLVQSGSKWTLWQDTAQPPISTTALNTCIENIEKLIIPRMQTIWGTWADIDGDGKIALLLCPTINAEKRAIGFFNPADLFNRDGDSASDNYNPYSNEMDLLYIAVPDESETGNYSASSISATIAHELTHAITFNRKTFSHIVDGNTERMQEELFLDEGWGHLSENLCGFGVSGGNISFFDVFLQNTNSYSFSGKNALGQEDTPGRRGAMTLFLSWLFWKSGGMDWDSANNYLPIDKGGIGFLQRMLDSDVYGWESIGGAYGKPTDELFGEMVYELNRQQSKKDPFIFAIDPYTGEPVEFFTHMGLLTSSTKTWNIGSPALLSPENNPSVLPWSIQFFADIECLQTTNYSIGAKNVQGSVYIAAIRN